MSKFLFAVFVAAAAVGVYGSFAGAAGPPATATGTWDCRSSAFTIESDRTVGGNRIFTWSSPACVYAGDLTGTFAGHGTRIVRSDGSFIDHGGLVCTGCTLGGRTGDFTAVSTFRKNIPQDAHTHGTIIVLSATGGLEGLHAVNDFEFAGSGFGTYSYRYSFEP
jgi:hypothetical protein